MFYELMMRKKEQIMYATIKGSLTENDGVVSGFSSSNYLEIPNFPTYTQDYRIEIVVNFTLNELGNGVIFSGEGSLVVPLVEENGKIVYYSSTIGNTSGTTVLSVGQNYYLKIIIDTNLFSAYISTDGQNWTLDKSKSFSGTFSKSGVFAIGKNPNISSQYLRGSIDLNESYIKLGSTKYNLQAVVGYTVVGSPTITDGVVSGFSANDYLNILSPKSVPTEIQSNNIKIKMKIKTPQQWSTSNMFLIGFNHSGSSDSAILYDGGIYITTEGNLTIHTSIINSPQPYIPLELDTIYYIEIETKGIFKIGISQDNVNWTYIQKDIYRDKWYLRNRNIRIGRAGTALSQEFNGEIFINETSFVINNKLWFNGQQA